MKTVKELKVGDKVYYITEKCDVIVYTVTSVTKSLKNESYYKIKIVSQYGLEIPYTAKEHKTQLADAEDAILLNLSDVEDILNDRVARIYDTLKRLQDGN